MEQVSGIATEIFDAILRSYDQLAGLLLYLVREGVGVRSARVVGFIRSGGRQYALYRGTGPIVLGSYDNMAEQK